MAEAEDLELAPADYPNIDGVPLEEKRRAWIIEQFCSAGEGPIFDSMVKQARDVEQFLISGAVPDGGKPKLTKVKE